MEIINLGFIDEHNDIILQDKEYEYINSYKKWNGRQYCMYVKIRHLYCKKISEVKLTSYKRGERPHKKRSGYCCCGNYQNSFAYHIEVELGIKLNDIWNWEDNNINPYHIYKSSNQKIWLYCQEHDYHNYNRQGKRVGYQITCANFYNGRRCGYCNSFASHKVHWQDSVAYKYPRIAEMIAIEENNLTFEDCYNIACYSNNKYYIKCNQCGLVTDTKKTLDHIQIDGFKCDVCDERFKTPEKFLYNVLKQVNIDFKTQLNKSTFTWCQEYKYDFYIPNLNMIIETHGEQHYRNTGFNRTLAEEQANDLAKLNCAKKYIDDYIVVNCSKSTLQWLRENVEKELSPYIDLTQVDWNLAWRESQSSLIIKAWELWDNGIHSTTEIAEILDKHRKTIKEWLKKEQNVVNALIQLN